MGRKQKGTGSRFRAPERKPAPKRRELIHDEAPDTKNIIRGYSDIEIDGYFNDGADVDAYSCQEEGSIDIED